MGYMDIMDDGSNTNTNTTVQTNIPNNRVYFGDCSFYVFFSFCCLAIIYLVTLIVFIIIVLKNNYQIL